MKYSVYYKKNPNFELDPTLTIASLTETHVKVREVEAVGLEAVYMLQQGEVWSPNGEALPLINELGLRHTSMSVGDVAVTLNKDGGEVRYYQVAPTSFREFV